MVVMESSEAAVHAAPAQPSHRIPSWWVTILIQLFVREYFISNTLHSVIMFILRYQLHNTHSQHWLRAAAGWRHILHCTTLYINQWEAREQRELTNRSGAEYSSHYQTQRLQCGFPNTDNQNDYFVYQRRMSRLKWIKLHILEAQKLNKHIY